jgi:hypothetical protein
MTQTELNSSLDRQLKNIDTATHRVLAARERSLEAARVLAEPRATREKGGVPALGIASLVTVLLFLDAVVAAPALVDRFNHFGMPKEVAWLASIGASILLMFAEMVAAIAWFRAYERSLSSRRYYAVAGWTLIGTMIIAGPILLGVSQMLVVIEDGVDDPARLSKEIGLLLLLGGAHLLLIGSGRYLEAAKTESMLSLRQMRAKLAKQSAGRDEAAALNVLAHEFRVHLRSVKRGRQDGLSAELGPFEDQTLALIRERHANIDETIHRYERDAESKIDAHDDEPSIRRSGGGDRGHHGDPSTCRN